MTHNQEIFKELDKSQVSKVRIGNGDFITVEGKRTVAIENCTGTKLIYDVLYVPEIHQNLLSVGQLIENPSDTQPGIQLKTKGFIYIWKTKT